MAQLLRYPGVVVASSSEGASFVSLRRIPRGRPLLLPGFRRDGASSEYGRRYLGTGPSLDQYEVHERPVPTDGANVR